MISIIIPTFNEEKVIKSRVENLTAKLTIPHEIIITDDESTDRTAEIAQQLPVKVVIHRHANNKPRTISGNRNNGAKYATGEFLVFLDASCRIEKPDLFFSQALKNFNDKNIVAVTGWVLIEPSLTTLTDSIVLKIINWGYLQLNNFFHKGSATGKFQMFRHDAFTKIGGFNEKLVTCEDVDIFNRMSHIGRTYFDTKLYVFHPGRREHQVGWIKLLSIWGINNIWVLLFGKALAKEWTAVR